MLSIDEGTRVIVVSGPNAGGKSVCMKTVGLLQMMVQAGLLIPASADSVVGVFKQIVC
jgi:DNA mismatch repair protein MutS2